MLFLNEFGRMAAVQAQGTRGITDTARDRRDASRAIGQEGAPRSEACTRRGGSLANCAAGGLLEISSLSPRCVCPPASEEGIDSECESLTKTN